MRVGRKDPYILLETVVQEVKICDKMQNMRRKHEKKKINLKALLAVLLLLIVVFLILLAAGIFRIQKVDVTGNSYYSKKEIRELVVGDTSNTIALMFQYGYMGGKEIPFVDKVEVSMVSPGHVKIRVYEKTLIGYVEYMGSNLYFDKDGTVVESSKEVLDGIPCIKGLKFDTLTLYQPLKVENKKVFDLLLSMNQVMKKYELKPDAITLKKDSTEIVLTFQNVRINLGKGERMDEKAARIRSLLPDLEGKSGVLHMEEYTSETTIISLMEDK